MLHICGNTVNFFGLTPHNCLSWGIFSCTQLRDAQWLKLHLKSCIVDVLWLKYSVVLWLKYHRSQIRRSHPFRCSKDIIYATISNFTSICICVGIIAAVSSTLQSGMHTSEFHRINHIWLGGGMTEDCLLF